MLFIPQRIIKMTGNSSQIVLNLEINLWRKSLYLLKTIKDRKQRSTSGNAAKTIYLRRKVHQNWCSKRESPRAKSRTSNLKKITPWCSQIRRKWNCTRRLKPRKERRSLSMSTKSFSRNCFNRKATFMNRFTKPIA